MSVTINRVIGSLAHGGRLKALHTFLRTQYDEAPDKVNLDYIVERVTAELRDLDKGSEAPREEEPMASCNFEKTNKRKFQPQESRSPKKGRSTMDVLKLNPPWLEQDMFNGMSSPIGNGFLEGKRSNNLLKAEIRRLRRAQGRGTKSQQQTVRSKYHLMTSLVDPKLKPRQRRPRRPRQQMRRRFPQPNLLQLVQCLLILGPR